MCTKNAYCSNPSIFDAKDDDSNSIYLKTHQRQGYVSPALFHLIAPVQRIWTTANLVLGMRS